MAGGQHQIQDLTCKANIKLTRSEKRFCDLLRLNPGLPQYKAYMQAFPRTKKENTASTSANKLLKKPEIHAYLQLKLREAEEATDLDEKWVLRRLRTISDRCMVAEAVEAFDPDMKMMVPTGEYKFDSSGANKSTELIGKHFKMFTDKIDVNQKTTVRFDLHFGGEKPKSPKDAKSDK